MSALSVGVELQWDDAEARLLVSAGDRLTGEEVVIPVDRHDAPDVYRRPFAYSRSSGA